MTSGRISTRDGAVLTHVDVSTNPRLHAQSRKTTCRVATINRHAAGLHSEMSDALSLQMKSADEWSVASIQVVVNLAHWPNSSLRANLSLTSDIT